MRNADGIHRAFAELLIRYHGTLDLLSGQGLEDVNRLIAESVAYAEVINQLAGEEATIVDVGSGAGLPGVVVAASLPKAKIILVERRRRRGAFLELATSRLGLDNVSVSKQDVKQVRDVCADVVTAQAVAAMDSVIRLTRHLQADPCYLVSRRGPGWLAELAAVREQLDAENKGRLRDWDRNAGGDEPIGGDGKQRQRADETTSAFTVPVEKRLDHRGSLVALRLTGGPACRSSGS